MNIANIMALTEASTGFNGGSYVDEMPHLSLTEAAGQLSMMLMESQIELSETTVANNESLVEAAVSAMQSGTPAQFDSLVEASWADIKAKIVKIMENIKKFIRSIIAKLTLAIDKMRMSGHQLYEKYKDSPNLKDTSKFKDMEVSGHKFSKNEKLFPAAAGFEADVEALIKKVGGGKFVVPSDFKAQLKSVDKENKGDTKVVSNLKDVSRAARVFNMAKELTGSSKITEGSWQSDLKTELYGEKVNLKYGTDYTVDSVAALLKEPAHLSEIKDEYIKLERAVEDYKKKLQGKLDELEREISKKEDAGEKTAGLSVAVSYYNAYMSLVSDSYSTINTVKNIKYNFEKAKLDQAKMLFGKMLSFKAKKDNNDASDVDMDIEYEIEL